MHSTLLLVIVVIAALAFDFTNGFHDTANARLTGTDGSTIALHMIDHLSFSASGIVNTFSLGGFTCG